MRLNSAKLCAKELEREHRKWVTRAFLAGVSRATVSLGKRDCTELVRGEEAWASWLSKKERLRNAGRECEWDSVDKTHKTETGTGFWQIKRGNQPQWGRKGLGRRLGGRDNLDVVMRIHGKRKAGKGGLGWGWKVEWREMASADNRGIRLDYHVFQLDKGFTLCIWAMQCNWNLYRKYIRMKDQNFRCYLFFMGSV